MSETGDGKVIAFPRLLPDEEERANLLQQAGEQPRCRHRRVSLHVTDREVRCRDCGEVVEAFDHLNTMAGNWTYWETELRRMRGEAEERRRNLEEIKREESNARSRLGRLREQAGHFETPDPWAPHPQASRFERAASQIREAQARLADALVGVVMLAAGQPGRYYSASGPLTGGVRASRDLKAARALAERADKTLALITKKEAERLRALKAAGAAPTTPASHKPPVPNEEMEPCDACQPISP